MPPSDLFKKPIPLDAVSDAYLRILSIDDISQSYVDGMNDPRTRKYLMTLKGTIRREDLVDYVAESLRSEDGVLLGLFIEGLHCGNARLHKLHQQSVWLGLALFDPSIWGRGWGTKTILGSVTAARDILRCSTIRAGVDIDNIASSRAFQKVGFVFEELLDREQVFIKNLDIGAPQ